MAGPSSLVVNLRFNPPEVEIIGPILESTVLKLGTLLPRMTSLSRNRARRELPQFQKEILVGVSLSANNINTNNNSTMSGMSNNNAMNSSSSNGASNPLLNWNQQQQLSKSQQQQQQPGSTNSNMSSMNNNNNINSSSPVVWKLELPFSMAAEVAQMQMMHAIVECLDEEGIWDMRDSTSFTSLDEGVDYISLIFVKKPKRKEL